jgi:rhodanese-related sulfurtransferase
MAAGAATDLGYKNVLVYQAGMPDWAGRGNAVQKGAQPGKFK